MAARDRRLPANLTWGQSTPVKRQAECQLTEGKEVVSGFAILKTTSKEEASERARKFLEVAGEGECELRQIYEPGRGSNCVSTETAEVALKG
jgi:hypothetical protein